MPRPTYFGAIEAGGTKFNCAFGLAQSKEVLESAPVPLLANAVELFAFVLIVTEETFFDVFPSK